MKPISMDSHMSVEPVWIGPLWDVIVPFESSLLLEGEAHFPDGE